jgi:hypothetical protein
VCPSGWPRVFGFGCAAAWSFPAPGVQSRMGWCCCRGQERFARTLRCPPSMLVSHRARQQGTTARAKDSPRWRCARARARAVRSGSPSGRFAASGRSVLSREFGASSGCAVGGERREGARKKILGLSFQNALVRGGAAEIPSEVELVLKSFLISTTGFTKINNLPFLRKEQ